MPRIKGLLLNTLEKATDARIDVFLVQSLKNHPCIHGNKEQNQMGNLIYEEESYKLLGICMEVHNQLGAGFLEIVYKDALEYELKKSNIPFEREREYEVQYKDTILPHKFYADFVIYDKIILEIKGVNGIADEFLAQCINYLKVSENKLALLVNFGEMRLQYKRIVL